jgi:cell wall-associated NlpC family hydrolase
VAYARTCARILLALVFLVGMLGAAMPVAADEPTLTEAQQIVQIAEAQVGASWQFEAVGPDTFDCSGLVTYVYREAGLLDRIGGKRRTVAGFHRWFKNHGQADLHAPQVGDLIVWGRNHHIGIYVGLNANGAKMAVSALVNPYGVMEHKLSFIHSLRITAYLHVDLQRS